MAIYVNLNVVMAQRRISSQELAAQVGITQANLSILKTGKAKAIRFSTLDAICKALDCQPGDILEYREGGIPMKSSPYENNPYTSSSEAPTQPLPPAPSLPAGRGRPSWPLLLALLAAFTANSLLYGGLALGSALGIFGIFTVTALYLLIKSKHFGWYPPILPGLQPDPGGLLCPQQRLTL